MQGTVVEQAQRGQLRSHAEHAGAEPSAAADTLQRPPRPRPAGALDADLLAPRPLACGRLLRELHGPLHRGLLHIG